MSCHSDEHRDEESLPSPALMPLETPRITRKDDMRLIC